MRLGETHAELQETLASPPLARRGRVGAGFTRSFGVMYFMYVDESGDPGRYNGSNTPHFILSGLIVPEEEWAAGLARMLAFREDVKQATGLPKKVEIHSSELIRPHKLDVYKKVHK